MARKQQSSSYTVTVQADQGRPAVEITLGDPKSARIVATKYQRDGRTVEIKTERGN